MGTDERSPDRGWHVDRGGREVGPLSARELRALAAAGRLDPADPVWRTGGSTRRPAGAIVGLFPPAGRPDDPVPLQSAAGPAAVTTRDVRGAVGRLVAIAASRAAAEVRAAAREAAALAWRLARRAAGGVGRRRHDARAESALLGLGAAAARAGAGDPALLAQLAALDDRAASLRAAGGSTRPAEVERRGVLLRLAGPLAAGESPPPGAEDAHAACRAADADRRAAQAALAGRRESLWPAGRAARVRAAAGLAAPTLAVATAVWVSAGLRAAAAPVASLRAEAAVAAAVGMAVCGVHVVGPTGREEDVVAATGTAFAVTPDGYLVTNRHVVEEVWRLGKARHTLDQLRAKGLEVTPRVWVFFGRAKAAAEVVHVSDRFDLAVLKADRRGPYFRLSAGPPARGAAVAALGFPAAGQVALSDREVVENVRRTGTGGPVEGRFKARDFEFVLTAGVVARMAEEEGGPAWVQHTAGIHPGNSGGPLATPEGLVVGINTLTNDRAAGTGFALATAQLRAELAAHVPTRLFWADE